MKPTSSIKRYKIVKIIELVTCILFEAVYVYIIVTNRFLKEAVFSSKYLFTLCLMMWILLLVVIGFLIYDFYMIGEFTDSDKEK